MTGPASREGDRNDPDKLQLTFWIAIVGISSVLLVFALALLAFHGAKDPGQLIPAVVGSVTGAIGTLAGLVAGHTAGAAGKAEAEQRANANEQGAAAGRALAQTVLTDAQPTPGNEPDGVERFGSGPTGSADVARRHAELAKRLFPDLERE